MYNLYSHGGSGNHGCEAIVRSTIKVLNENSVNVFSYNRDQDIKYGIDGICNLREDTTNSIQRGTLKWLFSSMQSKLTGRIDLKMRYQRNLFFDNIRPGDICLSVGGDNYCYAGTDKLGFYNRMLHEKGAKTVLWGCSVEPSSLTKNVIEDLKKYDLITVRESLSYEGLWNAGIRENVLRCSDPAFQLESAVCDLPAGYGDKRSIGINVSPLAAECGNLVMENYEELIRYILRNTDYNVLLIPHVVKAETDDRQTLSFLLNQFADTGRITLIDDHNCMELKYIISQCRMFIGARTHATIAAYSTCVPTLVAGYSVKASGIAKDIFGTDQNYVLPVQAFVGKKDLTEAFLWMSDHEQYIREYLKNKMPEYCLKSLDAGAAVRRLEG